MYSHISSGQAFDCLAERQRPLRLRGVLRDLAQIACLHGSGLNLETQGEAY